jgi:hypothetical protein
MVVAAEVVVGAEVVVVEVEADWSLARSSTFDEPSDEVI